MQILKPEGMYICSKCIDGFLERNPQYSVVNQYIENDCCDVCGCKEATYTEIAIVKSENE